MADNPYRMSLDDLARSTGHAPGAPTHEVEPEVDVPPALPLRVTPRSPVSEIAAFGQLAQARPSRRRTARVTAVVVLGLVALPFLVDLAHRVL